MAPLSTMLSDSTSISSKRVITFLAFVMCAVAFIAMILGHPIDTKLFDSMMYIVIAKKVMTRLLLIALLSDNIVFKGSI